jgi:hypothetical protein
MKQFVVVFGGGDWADARTDFLVFDRPITQEEINAELAKRETWYCEEYVPALRNKRVVKYETPTAWLARTLGGRHVADSDSEFLVVSDD